MYVPIKLILTTLHNISKYKTWLIQKLTWNIINTIDKNELTQIATNLLILKIPYVEFLETSRMLWLWLIILLVYNWVTVWLASIHSVLWCFRLQVGARLSRLGSVYEEAGLLTWLGGSLMWACSIEGRLRRVVRIHRLRTVDGSGEKERQIIEACPSAHEALVNYKLCWNRKKSWENQ